MAGVGHVAERPIRAKDSLPRCLGTFDPYRRFLRSGTLNPMPQTLDWVRNRLEELVVLRDRGWTSAEYIEYRDLCAAEVWLLSHRNQVAV